MIVATRLVRLPLPTTALILFLAALVMSAAGCDRGQVGDEPVSLCFPEGACTDQMFAQGLLNAPADPERGAEVFATMCAECHGPAGRGQKDTARIDFASPVWHARYADRDIADIIRKGRPPTMPPQPLSEAQLRDVIAHLRALRSSAAPGDEGRY